MIDQIAFIALGGAAGGLLRVWVTAAVDRLAGALLPWGTLAVNLSGSAILGSAAGVFLAQGLEPATAPLWAALGVGALGSYTTVSSFALQMHALVREGKRSRAAVYAGVTVGACLAFAAGGLALGQWVG